MNILSLNCGSSSVKYQLYDWENKEILAKGVVERVTFSGSFCQHEARGRDKVKIMRECPSHLEAIQLVQELLVHPEHGVISSIEEVNAVGHRLIHGGEKFSKSVRISDDVIETFTALAQLAPLHNPPAIAGVKAALEVFKVPQMGIIDTAWHQTMPDYVYMYALPQEWYKRYGIRRYGFHGTSLLYVSKRASVLLGKDPFQCNLILAHIGNGVSFNAVRNGVSYDTSMGFTPLEGAMMGTRSGDHDPAIPLYVQEREGLSPRQMNDVLNKKSGIQGVTGKFNDRRDVCAGALSGDPTCTLALEMECYRARKYIGGYYAALGRVDAMVFTAGVGEMGWEHREKMCQGLEYMGIKLDREKNRLSCTRNAETCISTADSPVKIFVIPTDEELVFAEDVVALLNGTYDVHTNFTYSFQKPEYTNAMRELAFEKECLSKPGLAAIRALPVLR